MNRSLIMGLVGGIGIATAGGVAGYAVMTQSGGADESGNAVVEEMASSATVVAEPAAAAVQPAPSAAQSPSAAPAARSVAAPAPRPAVTQTPAQAPGPVVTQAAAPVPEPVAEERCWDEEVVVQADPKDDRAIAGTATGAILGGAIARELGDDNDLATAAGAAAGAFAGRRIQRNIQENNTTTVIERRCEPVQ